MARLSQKTIASVQYQSPEAVVETKAKSWLDYLPHGCELPQLFRTGLPLEDCLDLIDKSEKELSKECKKACKRTCTSCYKCWAKAADALILSQQVDKAASGDSQMLVWTGKAKLRQTEPVENNDEVIPAVINIAGLSVDQESEIDRLRNELKLAYRKIKAIEAPASDKGGDADA